MGVTSFRKTAAVVTTSLVLGLVSLAPEAALVGYDLSYIPRNPSFGGDDTSAEAVAIFDMSNIGGTGTEWVTLEQYEITFSGPATGNVPVLAIYPNTRTSGCVALCSGTPNYVPFTGQFVNGVFRGFMDGFQRAPDPLVENLRFGNSPQGFIGGFRWGPNAPTKFTGETDELLLIAISGANALVPLPFSIWLLSSGLLGLIAVRRRTRG